MCTWNPPYKNIHTCNHTNTHTYTSQNTTSVITGHTLARTIPFSVPLTSKLFLPQLHIVPCVPSLDILSRLRPVNLFLSLQPPAPVLNFYLKVLLSSHSLRRPPVQCTAKWAHCVSLTLVINSSSSNSPVAVDWRLDMIGEGPPYIISKWVNLFW